MNEVRKVDGGVPVKSWATTIEDGTWEQATNLSRLPFAYHHIALLPDAHPGYGMPIGAVLAAQRAIVPYAVGMDVGCGVRLLKVEANFDNLADGMVRAILDGIRARVPVGNGPQDQHAEQPDKWHWETPAPGMDESDVAARAVDAAQVQLGTLGGGNHFLELQRGPDGARYFMLHSGSRSVGKKVCDHWHKVALMLNQRWHSALPDKELAYLPWESDEAHGYFDDMTMAMAWAEENRRRMAEAVMDVVLTVMGARGLPGMMAEVVDVHHNYAAWESHYGQNVIVHRKGAVRARVGDVVLVPGSMATASYVGVGLGNPESFETCQHGAGRARSRGATRRMVTVDALHEQMASAGVMLSTPNDADVTDESGVAYKDVDEVMAASADLVTPTLRLLPVGCVKG